MNSSPTRYRCWLTTPSFSNLKRNPMIPLEQKLLDLNLTVMSHHLGTTLSEAASKNLSAAAALEWLADMELEARRGRAIERRFKCSKLQAQPSIDAFHFSHHKSRSQNKNRVLRLLDLTFIANGTNLILIGNPGVGKTFLSKIVGWRACQSIRAREGTQQTPCVVERAALLRTLRGPHGVCVDGQRESEVSLLPMPECATPGQC